MMMPSRILPLLAVLLFCGFIQDEWTLFSPGETFSIELPGEPSETTGRPESHGKDNASWVLKVPYGAYKVESIAVREQLRSQSSDEIFASSFDVIKETPGFDLHVISAEETPVQGFPGKEYVWKAVAKDKELELSLRVRAIIAHDRVYTIMAMTQPGTIDTTADRVFSSFKILNP